MKTKTIHQCPCTLCQFESLLASTLDTITGVLFMEQMDLPPIISDQEAKSATDSDEGKVAAANAGREVTARVARALAWYLERVEKSVEIPVEEVCAILRRERIAADEARKSEKDCDHVGTTH